MDEHVAETDCTAQVVRKVDSQHSARSTTRSSLIDRSRLRTRTSSTTSDGLDELTVAALQSWQLVGVDLASGHGPADP